jgi:hypothetical protein
VLDSWSWAVLIALTCNSSRETDILQTSCGIRCQIECGSLPRFMSTDTDQRLIVHIPVNNILVGGA